MNEDLRDWFYRSRVIISGLSVESDLEAQELRLFVRVCEPPAQATLVAAVSGFA